MSGSDFYTRIREDYQQFMQQQEARFPAENCLRIDLHCHDHNSDVPDELWGRLLRLPETWLPTRTLVKRLRDAGTDLITITNHNNARSCWNLLDRGVDILPGAEFTCHFPDDTFSVHVLVYGFTPAQEVKLKHLRQNIYRFAAYALEHDLPTVLPHPLFFHCHSGTPQLPQLEKLALLFERFEVLNGQRGYWQNQLTQRWVNSLDEARIQTLAHKHRLDPHDFCVQPYRKCLTGGSDDHNGIFAGECGTRLYVDRLQERLLTHSRSELALEALRNGHTAPYGQPGEEERLTAAFLDYFSQVAINMEDPGLIRLMLHKGSLTDKLACLGISNAMLELRRHKHTLAFLNTFHRALHGDAPARWKSLGVSKPFKPCLARIKEIAQARRKQPEQFTQALRAHIPALYREVTGIFFAHARDEWRKLSRDSRTLRSPQQLLSQLELPTSLRALLGSKKQSDHSGLNLLKRSDQLGFPALAALVIAGASFAGRQVLYGNRSFLDQLSRQLDHSIHSQRILWLTDSLVDGNGVSTALQNLLAHIQAHDLPIDLLTCHPELEEQPHLQVVRPTTQIDLHPLAPQTLYIPDMLEIQQRFESGGYDRIICSTELCMGLVALYLKKAFSVPASFYLHTDWCEFFKRSAGLDMHQQDRLRRLLRLYYQQFDQLFVLNRDHRDWLASEAMGYPAARLKLTAHWVDQRYHNAAPRRHVRPQTAPTLLYAGRLSREKGVMDLIDIYQRLSTHFPDLRLLIAGEGPMLKKLKKRLPEADYLGWIAPQQMPELYLQADLLVLPSRFDTFGCVVLEAMATGLPVAAYNCKGPKDLIDHQDNGYLAGNLVELSNYVQQYLLSESQQQERMQRSAKARAESYQAGDIMQRLLTDMQIT